MKPPFPLKLLAAALPLLAALPLFSNNPIGDQLNWQERATELPEWMQQNVIYEVNVRQYSAASSFAAIEQDLDRIVDLGVGTLWFMPIHPIGEVNRKGPLGSYYAVADYYGVNPEFGTEEDFRSLVNAAHESGLKVIIDWVANHSAWDNPLASEQPELYVTDADGSFIPPHGTDWTDVIQFDLDHPGLVKYHADAMRYWVEEFGIDGFRCDYALGLPVEFWDEITAALQKVRPDIFMLAESAQGELQLNAFHATYGWELMHTFDALAQGKVTATDIDRVLAQRSLILPKGAREMLMTSNHDENTWLGTDLERFGAAHNAFAVLTFTMDGIPLIYNGQEAGLDKRIEFFENDPIDWKPSPMRDFYKRLVELRTSHPALVPGMPTKRVATTVNDKIFALLRTAPNGAEVLVITNLSHADTEFWIADEKMAGEWTDLFTGESVSLEATEAMELRRWHYKVLIKGS